MKEKAMEVPAIKDIIEKMEEEMAGSCAATLPLRTSNHKLMKRCGMLLISMIKKGCDSTVMTLVPT